MPVITDAEVLALLPPRGFIRQYVITCAEWTDAPLIYHLSMALALTATMCPVGLHSFLGATIRPNLYVLTVGDSVLARKSAALGLGLDLLETIEESEFVGDTPGSAEGLYVSLEEFPRQLIPEPEFSRFLSQAHKAGYLNPVKQAYTDLYDGRKRGRRTKHDRTKVPDTALSIVAAIAPGYLETWLEPQDLTSGFLARWFIVEGERSRWEFMPHRDPHKFMLLKTALEDLYFGIPAGQAVFTPEALSTLEPWARDVDTYARSLDREDATRGLIGRLQGLVTKLSMILAAADYVATHDVRACPPDPVDPPDIVIGKEIVDHAISVAMLHTRSVGSVLATMASSPQMLARRKVLGIIERNNPCSLGLILRQAKMLKRDLAPILDTLVEERTIGVAQIGGSALYSLPDRDLGDPMLATTDIQQ